jgi:hypothetical protein
MLLSFRSVNCRSGALVTPLPRIPSLSTNILVARYLSRMVSDHMHVGHHPRHPREEVTNSGATRAPLGRANVL